MIPRTLHRTVPGHTSDEVEAFWTAAADLHPDWTLRTWRDPLDPADFPLTAHAWDACTSGAQRAGLIRLEVLYTHGGIYIDSDVELYRPLDPLLALEAFAAWQDPGVVPDAVLGAREAHPAFRECIALAIERVPAGAHASGPDVTTDVLAGRTDVLLLPPGSFYPYHYSERRRRHEDHKTANPWAFGAHHWHASWLPEAFRG